VHGWNFVGNLKEETFEEIREYVRLKDRFENKTDSVSLKSDPLYDYWKQVVALKDKKLPELGGNLKGLDSLLNAVVKLQDYWSKILAKDSVYIVDIKSHHSDDIADSSLKKAQTFMMQVVLQVTENLDSLTLTDMTNGLKKTRQNIIKGNIDNKNPRLLVAKTIIEKNDPAYYRKMELGDDPYVITTTNYGNSNTFPDTSHGTECAGIIAALRNNAIGCNGVTNSVEIMPVRIQPVYRSDEQDKDVANAIRYAVDNGAQVINMSFGKKISPMKSWVDEAMKYAEQKGVLLIVAAMNDATNSDSLACYPSTLYNDKTIVSNLIKVGASTFDSTLVGKFSNYGKNTVHVFAPGDSIYTTKINNEYKVNFGTSFSAPVVAGLAAFIWSYYPEFTYKQIRYCVEKSATPIETMVFKPGTQKKVSFSSLCKTGGIVNAYQALLIAEQINKPSWKRKHKDEIR
jgi:subtilisin family serine protease